MELLDVRSAIADVERELKRLRNKITHREKQAADILAGAEDLRREESDLVDRYVDLVAQERKIVEGEADA